ncbi:reverse transcriptase domain-containing protein [Tanacetum coccineum]
MSAMANATPIVTTVTKPATKEKTPKDADATPRVNIQDFCEEHYEDILSVIMDKIRRDKRKEVHARLDFGESPTKRRIRESSQNSSARTLPASSDHPCMILTNTPFNQSNFHGWCRNIKMALGAKFKLGFINGSHAFLYTQSASELWKEIGERYGQSNGPLVYQLERHQPPETDPMKKAQNRHNPEAPPHTPFVFKRLNKSQILFTAAPDNGKKEASLIGLEAKEPTYIRTFRKSSWSPQAKRIKVEPRRHQQKGTPSRTTSRYSESEDSEGGHWKSKSRRHRSSTYEDDLSQPWTCEERNPFTPRIWHFSLPRTRMPSHVKTYDGSGDPEDHLKLFQSAAKIEGWAMPTWCHMFNSTLTGNARVMVDTQPKEFDRIAIEDARKNSV